MADLLKTPPIEDLAKSSCEEPMELVEARSTFQEQMDIAEKFTENCECIEKIKFDYPVNYNEHDPEQYEKVISEKTKLYMEEVLKHTNHKPQEYKKCYKRNHTSPLLFVKANKKHKKTLLTIRQAAYGIEENVKVQFGVSNAFSEVNIVEYVRAMEQICNYNILVTRGFRKLNTKIDIHSFVCIYKSHLLSLKNLKKVIDFRKSIENK
jgi:hypothetical protein